MSNNSDVLNFLEDVQNTVNIYNVRNALEAVSNAVSDLTKNFHLKASIFTDVSLSVISLLNVFDYVDDYNEAKLIGDESKKNAAFGQITSQFMDILGTAIGYVPGCKYTSLVLYVASDCLEAGTNIISKHIEQIREVERQIDEALGNKDPVNNWEELEQQLRDAGASESDIKALIDALKKLDDALSGSGVDTGTLHDNVTAMENMWNDPENGAKAAYKDANDAAQKYRDSFDEDGNYIDPDKNAGDGMGGAAGDTGDAEGARVDPLILDLNKDGFDIETKKFGAHFDLNCDGFAEKINWTRKDAILALDKNHNGLIDNGSEVFGDFHLLADGSKAKNGFEALSQYDTNGDGVIDENDEIFDQLRLWVDENGDGVSDQGELKSLKDMHIKAINLNYEYVNQSTGTEALIGNVATFIYEDDTIGDIGEMWVSSDLYDAIEKVIVGVTDMTDGLPNVRSYGKVNSLHAAIALDETGRLKELVEDFVSETDNDTRLAIVEDILHLICHTEDVEDGSRGSYVNAKNLAVIEALMGNGFMGVNGENPNSAAAPILNRVYNNLVELYCFAMIGSQITEHLNYIRADVDEDGNRNPYMGFFNRHMLYDLELGYISEKTFSDACSYLGYYGSNIENDYRLFTEFRTYIEANAPQYLGIVDTSVFGAIRDSDSGNYINGTTIADVIYGNGGNDTINGGDGNDLLFGGDGNDAIYGGKGNDTIYGDDGDDLLDGGVGDDILKGGSGNDTYVFAKGYGSDTIIDADGLNTLRFKGLNPTDILVNGTGDSDVTITIKGTNDTLVIKDFRKGEEYANYDLEFDGVKMHVTDKGSPFKHIFGGNGDDVLKAVVDDSIMHAFGGNDTVYGSDGNDVIYGNEGNDAIYAGIGDDIVYGGDGNDILDGGKGSDFLYGGSDNDTYVFGRNYGTDIISDSEGVSTIKIADGISLDELDIISVGEDIVISLSDSEDKLIINGFAENPDNYILEVGGERTSLKDRVSAVNDEFLSGSDESDYIVNENSSIVAGGSGDDRIIGNDGDEIIFGDSGNDQILSDSGNDVIFGGSGDGNDMLYGGAGNDTYIFNVGSGTDTIIDSEGINTILFGAGLTEDAMTAYRHNWNDLMITFEGVEDKLIIQGYFGSESNRNFEVRFADGTRYAYDDAENPIKQVHATEYDDWMTAWSDNGIALHGDGGNDNLTGGAGDDMLFGGVGNDTLNGNDGDDILDGGEGSDFLYGGLGNDTYRFGIGYGSDIIEDNDGDNKVELLDISSDAVSFEMTDRGELVITITESDDVLTIRNFDSERFTFKFADEVSGTFNVETGKFERILSEEELAAIEAAKTEDEFAQANADILDELYAGDNSVSELLTESDNTVISEVIDSASTSDENENTANQIDIQVMILTENMAAFLNESNISDCVNMQSGTDNFEFANQLLVGTQVS